MSIASYVTATSPSDGNNRDIIDSLSRLKSSLKTTDGKKAMDAFSIYRPSQPVDEDSDGDTPQVTQIIPATGETGNDKGDPVLPDVHVPMGLLAHLSLTGRRVKKTKGKAKDKILNDEDFDDTDVVRSACHDFFITALEQIHRALQVRSTLSQVGVIMHDYPYPL